MRISVISTLFAALASLPALATDVAKTSSPDGRLVVTTSESNGQVFYSASYDGKVVIEPSRLGLIANFGSLADGLTVDSLYEGSGSYSYELPSIKVREVNRDARKQIFYVSNKAGQRLGVEFVVENNAIAFRYIVPKQGETGSIRVMSEVSEFRFPATTTAFVTPQSDAMIGWKRTKPSYEEEYDIDVPMSTKSKFGKGYTFPALFKVNGGDAWALVSETGVSSKYCGSHLSDFENGSYHIAFPMPEENNGNGTVEPAMALPGETPWRTVAIGATPMVTAEQTITWDVVTPQYKMDWKPEYGKGTWSWILWQDASINYDDQKTYIDFAKSLGFQYVLVDDWWDLNIGYDRIADLVKYAKSQGVDIVLWYSSSGYWNDIVQGPINCMDRSIVRKQQMRWMKSIGVKGIKVDFFGGDKQETMRLYEEILSDAADNGLFVILHGTTIPRGWERMYPNHVGSEAVLASENLIFDQHYCDTEAMCATLHPFIRNASAIMEYGGSFLNRYMSRDNKSGNKRLTSQVFSLATAVAFQNPMQFFALAPNNLTDAPKECIDFLKSVPTTWDETRIIDGYPGKYVVLARRHGDTWYLAAINGTAQPLKLNVSDLPFASGSDVALYKDGKTVDDVLLSTVKANAKTGRLVIAPQGAVVMVGK